MLPVIAFFGGVFVGAVGFYLWLLADIDVE
jgi:hypothetical protein